MERESTRIATIIFSARNMIDVLRCYNQPCVYCGVPTIVYTLQIRGIPNIRL